MQAGLGAPGLQMGSPVGRLLYSIGAGHGVKQAGGIANMYMALAVCLHRQSAQQPCEAGTVINPIQT